MCRKCGSPPLLGPASKARCSRAIYATEKLEDGETAARYLHYPPFNRTTEHTFPLTMMGNGRPE